VLVVAPVLQVIFPVQPEAVSVAFSPSQQIVLSEVMVGATGIVPLVTVTELETLLEQSPTLQTAVYVPSLLTVMLVPVALVDQITVPPTHEVAVNVTEPVSQMDVGPEILIDGVTGFSFTSTVTVADVVHWSFDTTIV